MVNEIPSEFQRIVGKDETSSFILQCAWPPKDGASSVDDVQIACDKGGRPDISRKAIIELFRALETTGKGRFIVGRKHHPSRFVWRSVEASPSDTGPKLSERGSPAGHLEGARPFVEAIEHTFVLRRDFTAQITLPLDLTTSEANRIADFIKTLPFDVERT